MLLLRNATARVTAWPLWGDRAVRASCAPLVLLRSPSAAAASLYTGPRRATPEQKLNRLLIDATRARGVLALHRVHGESFDDVNLATCWSKLGRASPSDRRWLHRSEGARKLSALREQTSRQLRTLRPRELAITAQALAKLDLRDPAWGGFWKELEGVVLARQRSDFSPQALSNTACAFATAGHATHALMDSVVEECAERVGEFKPFELAVTAWALATAGHAAPALFDAIETACDGRVRGLSPQAMANAVWAFATASHAAPALFNAFGGGIERQVHNLTPQHLSKTAWAFATAGHAAPMLLDAIARDLADKVSELTAQELANLAWAFAESDHLMLDSSLFDQRFARCCDVLADEFSVEALCQLHQWRLWYAGDRAGSEGLPGDALLARCEAAFRDANSAPPDAAGVTGL